MIGVSGRFRRAIAPSRPRLHSGLMPDALAPAARAQAFGHGFLRDIWYFLAMSADLKPGRLARHEVLGEPVMVGRAPSGQVFALRDICPHRATLLSSRPVRARSWRRRERGVPLSRLALRSGRDLHGGSLAHRRRQPRHLPHFRPSLSDRRKPGHGVHLDGRRPARHLGPTPAAGLSGRGREALYEHQSKPDGVRRPRRITRWSDPMDRPTGPMSTTSGGGARAHRCTKRPSCSRRRRRAFATTTHIRAIAQFQSLCPDGRRAA